MLPERIFVIAVWACFWLAPQFCYPHKAPGYYIRHFDDESGLSQNSVTSIAFDDVGFAWLTTAGGLIRFDGQEFAGFNKDGLTVSNTRFEGLFTDPVDHGLYAVTAGKELVSIRQGTARRPLRFQRLFDLEKSLIDLTGFHEDRPGGVIRTRFYPGVGYKYHIMAVESGFCVYSREKIVFYSAGRPAQVSDFAGRMSVVKSPIAWDIRSDHAFLRKSMSFNNFISVDGQLFYHQSGIGDTLFHLTPKSKTITWLSGDITRQASYQKAKSGIRIINNPACGQAFAYLDKKLYLIRFSKGKLSPTTHLLLDDFDLREKNIVSVAYNSRTGVLLLGSMNTGLFVLTPQRLHSVQLGREAEDNIVYAHVPFSDSSVVTPQGQVLSLPGGEQANLSQIRGAIPSTKFLQLIDAGGNIWVRKLDKIYRFAKGSSAAISIWDAGKEPTRMYQAADNTIWIGFKDGSLSVLPPGATQRDTITAVGRAPSEVTYLLQAERASLWVGTTGGLYKFDRAAGRLLQIPGLKNKNIRSVHQSGTSQVWITTYGDGYFLLDGQKLYRLPLDARKYLLYAHCIIEDSSHFLWVPTNKGLFRISKSDLLGFVQGRNLMPYIQYYGKMDGIRTNEFNGGCQPCAARLPNGLLTLPSMDGLVWLDPQEKTDAMAVAPFVIDGVEVDGASVRVSTQFQLAADFRFFKVEVCTPNFSHRDNLAMYYRVQKVNSDSNAIWHKIDAGKSFSLYNTGYGDYIVSIRKITGPGNRFLEKQLHVSVSRPWFLQWWAIMGGLLLATGLIWIAISTRTRYLLRRNQALSLEVALRTQDLSNAMVELKSSEHALARQLQIQMRIVSVLSHDLHTPLRYIERHLSQLFDRLSDQILDDRDRDLGKSIARSAQKVHALTGNLLGFIKTTYDNHGGVSFQPVKIDEILEGKASFFADIAAENRTVILVKAGQGLLVESNRLMLEIIVHNLIDNAIKSCWKDTITLSAAQTSSEAVRITICDTAGGMPAEITSWLSQSRQKDSINQAQAAVPAGIGLGLIIVAELALMLGIVVIVDADDAGTCIMLEIPYSISGEALADDNISSR